MELSKNSAEYEGFQALRRELNILCDGTAHIFSAKIITGKDFTSLTNTWNDIVAQNTSLFDTYKGIDADKELEDTVQFQEMLNSVTSSLGIRIEFLEDTPSMSVLINDLISRGGTANLTVKILDNKPHGHVVTIWRQDETFWIHDPNLPEILEINEEKLEKIFADELTLAEGYSLVYDFPFPIERLFPLYE
jgi:hypothetical protein